MLSVLCNSSHSVRCSQVRQELRLTAFWVLVNEGHKAAVMLLTPPVVALFRLRIAWTYMAHFDPPAETSENCRFPVVADSRFSMQYPANFW